MQARYLAVLAVLMGFGCAPTYLIPPDGAYDYRVPVTSNGANEAFEALIAATLKITYSPTYRTHQYVHDFTSDTGIRLDRPLPDPSSPTGYRLAETGGVEVAKNSYSKVGAGLLVCRTSLGRNADPGVVVTVAHLVTVPDTLWEYMLDRKGQRTDILERMSVKVDEFLFATGQGKEHMEATLQGLNVKTDLALLTLSIPVEQKSLQAFGSRLGNVRDMRWGNLIYMLGYPHGSLRIAAGAVSLDPRKGRFNIDANVRPGYSGGPVVAVRDGLPNIELVGLCQGTSTRKVRRLVPDRSIADGAALSAALLGQIVVEEEEEVEYGLGFAVTIDEMKEFLVNNQGVLAKKGIDVRRTPTLKMWGF